jgi:hypothetical protein
MGFQLGTPLHFDLGKYNPNYTDLPQRDSFSLHDSEHAMENVSQHTDAAIAALGSKATYAGAGTSLMGWLQSSEAGVLIGIAIGLLGFIVNLYFKYREDRRQEAESEARLRAIRGDYL